MNLSSLSKQYHFSDFTLLNYSNLLKLAQKFYRFEFFTENLQARSIILRHDLDISVEHAFYIAKIEEALGIKSTYFIQLHSEFYNPFNKTNYKKPLKYYSDFKNFLMNRVVRE